MFNLSIGSELEWPAIDGLKVFVSPNGVLGVIPVGEMLRVKAMKPGFCELNLTMDDAFFAQINIRVYAEHGGGHE